MNIIITHATMIHYKSNVLSMFPVTFGNHEPLNDQFVISFLVYIFGNEFSPWKLPKMTEYNATQNK